MKKNTLIILPFLLSALLFSGCQNMNETNRLAFSLPETEMRVYQNKTEGYNMTLPKSWGSIQVFGGHFDSNLYDNMETIGPDLINIVGTDNFTFNNRINII